jgi:hypothetical protein
VCSSFHSTAAAAAQTLNHCQSNAILQAATNRSVKDILTDILTVFNTALQASQHYTTHNQHSSTTAA